MFSYNPYIMKNEPITAEYIGAQENPTGPDFPLYNIIGGRYDGSTVTTETLIELGIPIPAHQPDANGSAMDEDD